MKTRTRGVALGALAAIILAIGAAPVVGNGERRSVASAREDTAAKRGGAFATLTHGVTHYERAGDPEGQSIAVVLIHGASGPMAVWDRTWPALVKLGLPALRYDLYGRGLSDRPDLTYDLNLYVEQLGELTGAVGFGKTKLVLVGSSMGAIIASEFTRRFPDRVDRVALIGPAGFAIEANAGARLLPVPGVGDWAIRVFGDRLLPAHNRKYYVHPERYPEAEHAYREQLAVIGYKRAILSTMRSMPMNDYREGYAALAESGRAVMLLWGAEDRTFPASNFEPTMKLLKPVLVSAAIIEGAAHVPQYENPERVNKLLASFIEQRE